MRVIHSRTRRPISSARSAYAKTKVPNGTTCSTATPASATAGASMAGIRSAVPLGANTASTGVSGYTMRETLRNSVR